MTMDELVKLMFQLSAVIGIGCTIALAVSLTIYIIITMYKGIN